MTYFLNLFFIAVIILITLAIMISTAVGLDWQTRRGRILPLSLLLMQILVEYWVIFWGRDIVFVGIDQAGELRVFTQLSQNIQYTMDPLNISFFDNYSLALVPLLSFFMLGRALFLFLGNNAWLLAYHILLLVTAAIKSVVLFIFLCKYTSKPLSFVIASIIVNSFFFISPSWWIGLRESFALIWLLLILLNPTYKRVGAGMALIFFTHYLVFFISIATVVFPLIFIRTSEHLGNSSRDFHGDLMYLKDLISNNDLRSYFFLLFLGPLLLGILILPLISRYVALVADFLFNMVMKFSISSTVLSYFTNTALWFLLTFILTVFGFLLFIFLWRKNKTNFFFDLSTVAVMLLLTSTFFIDDFGPERIFSSGIYFLTAAILQKLKGIEFERRQRFLALGILGILINPITFTPMVASSQSVLIEGNSNFENLLLKTSVGRGEYLVALSLSEWDEGRSTIHCDWNQFRALLAFTQINHSRFKVFQTISEYLPGDFVIIPPYYLVGRFMISVDWEGSVVKSTKLYLNLNLEDFTNIRVIQNISIYKVL
ncbi:MAG: hypothetical protein ACFFE8_04380 [Candidatus Heimdallarchaeota archaeon]